MIDSTVFYTKNGVNLGVAFDNVPQNMYPTVGLQSPGEIADANFGNFFSTAYRRVHFHLLYLKLILDNIISINYCSSIGVQILDNYSNR